MELKVKDKSKCFDEIYWFLCEQYRKANPLRFILLVGVDDELPYDIANYILGHRYQNGYLRCIDCPAETDIVEHISQMRFGTVLLLRGLEKASQVVLIPIIRKIESVIYDHNEKPRSLVIEGEAAPCDEFGTLIINTSNPNIIPEYIRKYFKVISIEPEIPANTPEKQGKDIATSTPKVIPFPTPSGTQWPEVKISFIDDENVKISARNVTEHRHYSSMGFKDSKSNKPIFLWKFLKELASLSGKFTNSQGKDKAKKCFSDLRKALNQVFKTIEGNSISYKKTKDYTGYETSFVIEDKSPNSEYEESIRRHHREYVPPKKPHSNYNEDSDFKIDD